MKTISLEEMKNLTKGLKVEVQAALAGETNSSVALLLKPDRLPRAVVTDSRGVVHSRVISYVDLLATLDAATTIGALTQDATRHVPLHTPPDGTLLMDLIQRASSNSYLLSGYVPSEEYLITLEQTTPGQSEKETTTYDVSLPPIVYRALWDEVSGSCSELSIGVLSPELEGKPSATTEVFRWPFSNVYTSFGGVLEGVCWPAKGSIRTPPGERSPSKWSNAS